MLKDDQILSAVGMEPGNAIHVVRAKKPTNTTNTSSTNSFPTTSSQQGNLTGTSNSATSTINSANTTGTTTTNIGNSDNNSNNDTSNLLGQNLTSPPVNPYAALMSGFANNSMGGQNINSIPSPFNPTNPFAANNANMNNYMLPNMSREEMNEMSRNPMMQQMMAQMMQNPQIMQQIMQSSPYLQNMPA